MAIYQQKYAVLHCTPMGSGLIDAFMDHDRYLS